MEFFEPLFRGVREHPTAALLVISLLALGWLFRDGRRRDAEYMAAMQRAHAEHLQTALTVVPVAHKLADCLALFERLIERRTNG